MNRIPVRDELGRAVAVDICGSGHDKTITGKYPNGECKECRRRYNQTALFKDRKKGRRRRISYGVSPDQYAAMLVAQLGVCAICGQPETLIKYGAVQQLAIDHDHETGQVRGLLCNNCNRAMGLFKDDPDILIKAASYLVGWEQS